MTRKALKSKKVLMLVSMWTFIITVSRAIRFPNDFSETHWLLDYRFGFIKRGLVGFFCSLTSFFSGGTINPFKIRIWAGIVFIIFSILIFYIFLRFIIKSEGQNDVINAFLIITVFASSPFVVMVSHLFGYFDVFIYVFTILAIISINKGKILLSVLIASIAFLVHENFFLIGYPPVLFALYMRLLPEKFRFKDFKKMWVAIIPIFVFSIIIFFHTFVLDKVELKQQLTDYLIRFDFIPTTSRRFASWHTAGFLDFFNGQKGEFFNRLSCPDIFLSYFPTLATLLIFIHSKFSIQPFSFLSSSILLIILSPMLIHLVAFDTARISLYTIWGAFILLWILYENRELKESTELYKLFAFPGIFFNIFSTLRLMDGCVERFSTFTRFFLYIPTIFLVVFIFFSNRDYKR